VSRPPFLACMFLLGGCFPEGRPLDREEHFEAARLVLAYEGAYDVVLVPAELDCIHSVKIVVSTPERDRWCDAFACYWVDALLPRRRGVMFFPEDLLTMPEPSHGQLLRHELLHRLLDCVEDDADVKHVHPGWSGRSTVPAPTTSIVATAASYDPADDPRLEEAAWAKAGEASEESGRSGQDADARSQVGDRAQRVVVDEYVYGGDVR
jgi:hypothetical protein